MRWKRRDYPYDRDIANPLPPVGIGFTLLAVVIVIVCVAVMIGGV